jgi:hypothetical protein
MNIRIGRFISLPDIEAQLAPDNYMFSHSVLYGYDPYTQMDIVATIKLLMPGNECGIRMRCCRRWRAARHQHAVRLRADPGLHPGMGDRELHQLADLAARFAVAAQRVPGTATRYYGIGLSWAHLFKQNVFVRPEMTYYQAMDNPAFAQGTKFTQLVAAVDFIVRF